MAQPQIDPQSSTPDLQSLFDNFCTAFHHLANNIQSRLVQIEQRDKDWTETQAKVLADAQKVWNFDLRSVSTCKLPSSSKYLMLNRFVIFF